MTTNPVTPDTLTPRQKQALKRIASGFNAEYETWSELFDMDLVASEYDDENILRDELTPDGWKLLREIEVISLRTCKHPESVLIISDNLSGQESFRRRCIHCGCVWEVEKS